MRNIKNLLTIYLRTKTTTKGITGQEMTENLLNKKAFISFLADRFNITQGEASFLS